jgi:glycosyltransferase involved in cell wall biosynthesis
MRIGFDARCLEEERISGVGEYTFELLKNILEIDRKNTYVVFSNSFKQKNVCHFDFLKNYTNVELKRFSVPNKILNFLFWYLRWPKIDSMIGSVDVFLAPNINFLSLSEKCPLIVTFHDLSFERFPNYFSRKTRWWHEYFVNPRKIARSAKMCIAVSESTARDLSEIYKINPSKIEIIFHGVSDEFRTEGQNNEDYSQTRKKYALPDKFVLFLGNIEPRKNVLSVARAFEELISKNSYLSKYHLILAGNMSSMAKSFIERKNVKLCGYIKRKDRPTIFKLSSVFVYPSFFEGFGLPVLESMASGTPVIASNNSSVSEVCQEAAVLIDPNRPDEIMEALRVLLTNAEFRDNMKERGLAQAKKFAWKQCAENTLALLRRYE